jgi:hypothetical protein
MYRGELDEALTILRRLPPSDAATTFLGLALARLGHASEARTKLADVARTAGAGPYAALAREAIAEMEADAQAGRMNGGNMNAGSSTYRR